MKCNKLVGKRFGALTVIGTSAPYIHKSGRTDTVSIVRCDCGNVKSVRNCSLTSGLTTSCGCANRKRIIDLNKKRAITGMSHSRIYTMFRGMHSRCENPHHVGYKNYGSKGISVCEEWGNFENFYNWAIKNGYNDSLTIDRIDSSLGYCPENCRFVTIEENERNKSRVKKYHFKGESLTLPQIADRIGVSKFCLYQRIKAGVRIEVAFTAKPSKGNKFKEGVYKCE